MKVGLRTNQAIQKEVISRMGGRKRATWTGSFPEGMGRRLLL